MMDRLLREGNPPAGQLASPKPQYKDVQTNNWEELKGEGGASYVKDKDVLAKLEQARILLSGVATEAKLEEARALLESVAGKDFATQATLAQVKSELELVKAELAAIKANQLSGDQKVQLSGNIVELFRRTGLVLTAGSRIKLNPEPIDVSAFRGWQIGVYHLDQHSWVMRKIWYSGFYSHSATNSGFFEVDELGFRSVSPVYPCLGDTMDWWMSNNGTVDTPNFHVRVWGVK